MRPRIHSYYSIFIGISVIAMWLMILTTQTPPEGRIELTFHLFSEFLMACICIVSGILLLKNNPRGRYFNLTGLGMVLYSVLNAAGYYGELNNVPMMVMFITLSVLTLVALGFNITHHIKS